MSTQTKELTGGCVCGAVRYRMTARPMIVHCCHCGECQRETGSAFALNAVIEAASLECSGPAPVSTAVPTASGNPHAIRSCPTCRTAVWSEYSSGPALPFIRVGTLDDPGLLPPDVHIFTSYKQPWVQIPNDAKAFPEFYDYGAVWTEESLERLQSAMAPD